MIESLGCTTRPSTRLNRGNVVLANAGMVDSRPIQARLDAFTEIHRRYIEAQAKVAEAKALERHELGRVADLDGAVNHALNRLSVALLLDGAPRRNPFSGYAELGPGKMTLLSFARKAAMTHDLAMTLHRSLGVSKTVLQAADEAERAAAEVEVALAGWNMRRTYLALTRQARDALGPQWDAAYGALNHLSRSLIEVPTLHATLFAQPRRSAKRIAESLITEPSTSAIEPRAEKSLFAGESALDAQSVSVSSSVSGFGARGAGQQPAICPQIESKPEIETETETNWMSLVNSLPSADLAEPQPLRSGERTLQR